MSTDERIKGRSAPIYTLSGNKPICPECNTDLSPMTQIDDGSNWFDEWTCWKCHAALEFWWDVEDLYWYSADDEEFIHLSDKLRLEAWLFNGRNPDLIGYDECLCHDSLTCPNKGKFYDNDMPYSITGAYVTRYLGGLKLDTIGEVYEWDEKGIDCRSCERYSRFDCLSLRAWIRKDLEVGCIPEEDLIAPCTHFVIDKEWLHGRKQDPHNVEVQMNRRLKGMV